MLRTHSYADVVMSDHARFVFLKAQEYTLLRGDPSVGAQHVLLALLDLPSGAAANAFEAIGLDRSGIRAHLEACYPIEDLRQHIGEIPYHESGAKIVENVIARAGESGERYVSTGHVLLAALANPGDVAHSILADCSVDVRGLIAAAQSDLQDRPPPK